MFNEVGIFFSLFFFLIGSSYLASTKEWTQFYRSLAEKEYSGIPIALFILPAAMVILSFHNSWSPRFSLFITIAGWAMGIKGVLLLLFPYLPNRWIPKARALPTYLRASGAVMMVFSALAFFSFYI